jgi:hypothetical protein
MVGAGLAPALALKFAPLGVSTHHGDRQQHKIDQCNYTMRAIKLSNLPLIPVVMTLPLGYNIFHYTNTLRIRQVSIAIKERHG